MEVKFTYTLPRIHGIKGNIRVSVAIRKFEHTTGLLKNVLALKGQNMNRKVNDVFKNPEGVQYEWKK